VIASAIAFGISLLIARAYPDAAFFEMPARFWELSVGGCIASLRTRGNVPRWLPGIALAGCVLSCCFSIQAVPGDGAILAIAATSTLLFCVHRSTNLGFAGVVLASKPMVALGLISYSLYLWHWPLLAYYRTLTIGQGSSTVRALLCLLALLLAIASYRYIEQPFRHGRFKTRPILIVGALATTMTAVGSVAWASHLRFERDAEPKENPIAAFAEADFPRHWDACHYQAWDTNFPKCVFPEATTAIWGDSMAMSWSNPPSIRCQAIPNACSGTSMFSTPSRVCTRSSWRHAGKTMAASANKTLPLTFARPSRRFAMCRTCRSFCRHRR